jgi:hypothetical protein
MSKPSRQIILRNSERKDLKRCPWRWWKVWREGLRPLNDLSDALWFGTGVHLALAVWYCGPGLKRGRHPAETFDEWSAGELRYVKTSNRIGNGAESIIEEKLVPARELGLVLLDEYVKHWGSDDSWYVLQPECTFQVDILDPDDPEAVMAILAGTYDLVYREMRNDYIWLGEHKTAKAVVTEHLPLDDQAGTYWAVAGQHLQQSGMIKKGERLRGINYNFLRKAMPDTRPRTSTGHYTNKPTKAHYIEVLEGIDALSNWRKMSLEELQEEAKSRGLTVLGDVSRQQPQPLFVRHEVRRTARERQQQIQRIQGELIHMEAYREGWLPLIKRTTRDCQWDCSLYNMCLLHEGGSDWQEYRDSMYHRQDPYADHRKSTEE